MGNTCSHPNTSIYTHTPYTLILSPNTEPEPIVYTPVKNWFYDYKNINGVFTSEDGSENLDTQNYPFWYPTLRQLENLGIVEKLAQGPGGNNAIHRAILYRVYPYKGYVSVSDVWAGYPDGGSVDETKDKLKIAMIKRNSSDPNNPYAKKSKTGRMLEVLNKYQGFCGTWDGPKLASCGTICKSGIPDNCAACNFTFASCGFEVEGDNADRWDGDGGITVYRPDDVDNGKYINIGCVFQAIKGGSAFQTYSIRYDLLVNLQDNAYFYSDDFKTKKMWETPQGRKFADSNSARRGCNFDIWSTAMTYDENNKILLLSAFDGYFNNDKDLEGWEYDSERDKNFYFMRMYYLQPLRVREDCCKNPDSVSLSSGSTSDVKCGWGSFMVNRKSPSCFDYARSICYYDKDTNPESIASDICVGDPVAGKGGLCINKGVNDDGILVCDDDFSNFCREREGVEGNFTYPNYTKYPDICACFMPAEFLSDKCNKLADKLGILGNKLALKALNLDTSDPTQCNQNCAVNEMCRSQSMKDSFSTKYGVKNGFSEIINGVVRSRTKNRFIQKGGVVDKGDCPDSTICTQSITINNEGKLDILNVNQWANCQGYNVKRCMFSTLSSVKTVPGNPEGNIYKTILKEEDGGSCGTVNQNILVASYNLTPISDKCVNGYRVQIFSQTMSEATDEDGTEGLKYLAYTGALKNMYDNGNIQQFNPIIEYVKDSKLGFIITDCNDCVTGYKKIEGQGCYLSGNQWKQKSIKDIKIPKKNGGSCNFTFNPTDFVEQECEENKDCEVTLKQNLTPCVNESRKMEFTINKLNSNNGRSCTDLVMSLIPPELRDNNPAIELSDDMKTVTASVSCKDCVVGYGIDLDTNNGRCFYDGQKWVITKIPRFVREATAGGACSSDLIELVSKRTKIIEPCSAIQDCQFNTKPDIDECDEKNGVRKTIFSIKNINNGTGLTCEDVGKQIGKQYTNDETKVVYSEQTKLLTIESKCGLIQNCVLSDVSSASNCDQNTNKGVETFRILKRTSGSGKTCNQIAKQKFGFNITTEEKQDLLYVYKNCGILSESFQKIKYIVLIVIIVILCIFAIVRA
jgi:hypothetical protein